MVEMMAPVLKSIRECLSLHRLPSVGARGQEEKKQAVEIEKDAWDDDHFEPPIHSRYYKEKLPRVSVLRYAIPLAELYQFMWLHSVIHHFVATYLELG
ncbi:hypothetical protein ZWY2020_031207 [Hordeum vulgare]|nr:hypothetical protein ZWY2020_031207 [Hordeum vulgare]